MTPQSKPRYNRDEESLCVGPQNLLKNIVITTEEGPLIGLDREQNDDKKHSGATNSIFEKKAITKLIKDSQEMKKKKLMERAQDEFEMTMGHN